MALRAIWFPIGLCSCIKQPATAEMTAPPPSPHPDLVCVAPTEPAGLAPPQGWEVWCQLPVANTGFQRQGPSIAWHNNEQRSAEGAWSAGRKSGTWQFWYPTGQLEKTGNYVNGVEDGVWVSYHPRGQRAGEGQMVDGKEDGEWTYWSEDGATHTVGKWSLGLRDGTWIEYNTADAPVRERQFRGGRLVSTKEHGR